LQQGSEHPLARAVLARAGPDLPQASAFRAMPGRGVTGMVDGRTVILGSARALAESGVAMASLAAAAGTEAMSGHTLAWLIETAPMPRALALLAFRDAERAHSASAIAELRSSGLRVAMLSGDGAAAVGAVASRLGITDFEAEALPERKAAAIAAWQQAGARVAMVGDGVNDAPALAAADLGMAMGSGTDIALQAAAITLLRDDPRLVPAALAITRRTLAKIRENLVWAFGYNAIGLPLAALGWLAPAAAGAAMALSSVAVLANALILSRWRPSGATPPTTGLTPHKAGAGR